MEDLDKKIEDIVYKGMFCDINECRSQNIDMSSYYGLPKKPEQPCNCGGEAKRLKMVEVIKQLVENRNLEWKQTIKEAIEKSYSTTEWSDLVELLGELI